MEAWYTVLIEALWPKRRIIEVYANIAEFGDGVYGAQAAARTFFRKDASRLAPAEAARMAAVLPSPRRYDARPARPLRAAAQHAIQRQMRYIWAARPALAARIDLTPTATCLCTNIAPHRIAPRPTSSPCRP